MSYDLNKAIVSGRICNDLELKTSTKGVSITEFAIAIKRAKEDTLFLDVVAFKEQAEFITKFFAKGKKILIEGEMTQSKWEKDGKKYSKDKILCNRAYFQESKDTEADEPKAVRNDEDDGLPF